MNIPDSFSFSDPNKTPLILDQKSVAKCHIYLPDTPQPTSAIIYRRQFYSYVKFFPNLESALRAAGRLLNRDNPVILTQVKKGFVLWVFEPEAELASKNLLK